MSDTNNRPTLKLQQIAAITAAIYLYAIKIKKQFSKQPPQLFRHPIHNHQLPTHISLPLPLIRSAIPNIHRLKVKTLKHPSDIRVIVDADHLLTFATAHEVGHPFVVFKRKVHSIPCGLPVRRIHIVKRMAPVIALSALKPRQGKFST